MSPSKSSLLRFSYLFFLLIILYACAPIEPDDTAMENDPADQLSAVTNLNLATTEKLIEERTVPEPEQTVVEEVTELKALGNWEEGKPEQIAEEKEVQYDFPVTMNKHVEFYLDSFQTKQRKTFTRWLERSGRYLPMIQEQLQKAGMPLDLAYLPMIESGFSLTAYSRARAVGPWQFIRATGRNYGLTVNSYIDERRNPGKATKAAIAYLSDLYDEFGSWHLAVAAYNAGEGKIRRAIKRYKTDNFWELAQKRYLKLETKRYVPKLIAAIMIAKNPEQYGFNDIEYEKPLSYETVGVPRWTSLQAVAIACDVELEELHNLNRELRRKLTPPNYATYPLKVPLGKKALVAKNLPRVQPIVTTKYKQHVVKGGETITKICRRYNLNKTTLLKANNLRATQLTLGQHLRIPYQTTTYKLLAQNTSAGRSGPAETLANNLVLHKVRPGETVSEIATRYNVSPHMIAAWNDLKDLHRINAGQQLALYLQDVVSHQTGKSTQNAQTQTNPLENTSPSLITEFSSQSDSTLTYYQVRGGDTLWSIAKKYQLTPQKIKTWNKIEGDIIYPGSRLLLKLAADVDA